jgi:protein O-mannosyl-transferase
MSDQTIHQSSSTSTQEESKSIWFALLFILVVCIAWAYGNTLQSPFVYDDKIEVIGNETIRDWGKWKEIASYNPSRMLLLFSYAYNFHLDQFQPLVYHQYNIAIHICSFFSVFFLFERLSQLFAKHNPTYIAIAIAGIWALHPMTTESVTYITGRSESLCLFFSTLSMGFWAHALLSQKWLFRIFAILALTCACLTKEVGLMTIVPLIYLEFIKGNKKLYLWLTPLSLLILLALATRFYVVQGENPDMTSWELLTSKLLPREVDRPIGTQLTTQSFVWLKYVALWILPIQQTIYHHVPDIELLSLWGVLSWTGWFLTLGGLFWVGRKDKACTLALICLFIYLIPSSSFAPLKEHMAEHRSLQFGLYFIAYIIWYFNPKLKNPWVILVPCAILTFWTYQRNNVWKSEVSLWEEATQMHPEVGEAWYGLGDALRFADRHEEAEIAFQTSIQKDPEYWDAYNNLGLVRIQMNDVEGAITAWEILLKQNTSYCKAHNNLGLLAARMGQWQDSLRNFTSTLTYCPNNLIAHYGLGTIYYESIPNKKRAIFHYEMLLQLKPNFEKSEEVRKRLLELTW